ncbi:MAG: T9SS type A sorting domain-containing protein [Flavobacterium sp.]|nr:T9SS type A sorting domain-containing protein [Flavobacterium sp.]
MKKLLLLLLLPFIGFAQNQYNYGFNSPTATMIGVDGWTRTNQSDLPSATSLWTVASYTPVVVNTAATPPVNATPFQNQAYTNGQTCPTPNGQAGGANSFSLVNYTSTTSTASSGATISNWLISPVVSLQNGDIITFYTRIGKYSATGTASYADRLELRLSTSGAFSAAPSTGSADVGDFTNLLVSVNPNLVLSGPGSYPGNWTQFSYTVSGLTGIVDCELGFRYFVTDGGSAGSNSDIIGIDTLSIDRPLSTNQFFTNNFTIQPNPVNDIFTVSSKNDTAIQNITVTDINGRVVSEVSPKAMSQIQVNVSELNSGVYFVKVQSEAGVGTSKIIKK